MIGNTIPLVGKEIIVSYAEIQQGHLGVVYQATNWIYTGLSSKRTNWTIEGNDKHCQTIADKYTAKEIREKYGDKFSLVDRPRKHRYVYFNCSKTRKKQLLKKLKYKIEAIPKKIITMKKQKIGWSDDITGTSGKLSHYYIDGVSLCGKWVLKHFMKVRDSETKGSKPTMHCMRCENKRAKLK